MHLVVRTPAAATSQADVPVWSPRGPASLERSGERRVQVNRRHDLRTQGKGTRRQDVCRGFFLLDTSQPLTAAKLARVSPEEDSEEMIAAATNESMLVKARVHVD
jgi:hypothetical protein